MTPERGLPANSDAERYGRLTVLSEAPRKRCPSGTILRNWKCRCDCGKEVIVQGNNLGNYILNSHAIENKAKKVLDSREGVKYNRSMEHIINWHLIAKLPADGIARDGGPDYGAFKVCHAPSTRLHVEHLLAETGCSLYRRRMVPRPGKPMMLASTEMIAGRL